MNSSSSSAVVNLGPEQRHLSPPPLARFGDSPPKYLGALCILLRETSPVQGFAGMTFRRSADVRPESSDPECFRIHSWSSRFGGLPARFWRRCRWNFSLNIVADGISSSRGDSRGGPGIPVSTPTTSKFHFSSSLDRFTAAPLLTRRFSANWSALKHNHVSYPTRCSFRRSVSSPPATADPSVRQLGCSHFVVGDQCKHQFTKHAQR